MGAGLIAGGVAVVLLAWNMDCVKRVVLKQMRPRRFADEELEIIADAPAVAEPAREDVEPSPPKYESLRDLHRRQQRRVRFAKTVTEYQAPPSSWFSTFYKPNRQRFETTIVDGVYMRHGFSSSGHSIESI